MYRVIIEYRVFSAYEGAFDQLSMIEVFNPISRVKILRKHRPDPDRKQVTTAFREKAGIQAGAATGSN